MLNIPIQIIRYWSVVLGGKAIRVSAFDEHGSEFYALSLDEGTGKARRTNRERICFLVREAMESGKEPGEISV